MIVKLSILMILLSFDEKHRHVLPKNVISSSNVLFIWAEKEKECQIIIVKPAFPKRAYVRVILVLLIWCHLYLFWSSIANCTRTILAYLFHRLFFLPRLIWNLVASYIAKSSCSGRPKRSSHSLWGSSKKARGSRRSPGEGEPWNAVSTRSVSKLSRSSD